MTGKCTLTDRDNAIRLEFRSPVSVKEVVSLFERGESVLAISKSLGNKRNEIG